MPEKTIKSERIFTGRLLRLDVLEVAWKTAGLAVGKSFVIPAP